MTNALTNYESGNDGFGDTAAEAAGTIVGIILKFNKGMYYAGTEEVPIGTELVAIATQVGWIKWQDGKPVELRMRAANARLPSRESLGDLDKSKWETGSSGPIDPWKLTRYLQLVDPKSAKDFTFVTSSWGGHDAIRTLARQLEIKRTHQRGATPVLKLAL